MVKGGRNSFTSDAHAYVCVVVKKLTSAFRAENEKLSFFLFVFYFVFFFFPSSTFAAPLINTPPLRIMQTDRLLAVCG